MPDTMPEGNRSSGLPCIIVMSLRLYRFPKEARLSCSERPCHGQGRKEESAGGGQRRQRWQLQRGGGRQRGASGARAERQPGAQEAAQRPARDPEGPALRALPAPA